ncbi:MAG: V-type ATP synthase subunit K [Methanomassiliicoccales archaeon]|nr:MAG: V-type ATP synthase subunit K [Methanomassiliicoccales archaeon]
MALDIGSGIVAIAAAIVMVGSAMATAWAEKVVGAAAVGAMAENEALFGKGIVFMVLPETIVLFGFAIAFLLLSKIT